MVQIAENMLHRDVVQAFGEGGKVVHPQFGEIAESVQDEGLEQRLLDTIQSGFPLVRDPYGKLAADFGESRDAVVEAVRALFAKGSIRRIGASFDSRKLGYTSSLCAIAVPGGEEELRRVADIVSAVPGVTHNYGRKNRYNLWFTLITRSEEQRKAILEGIARDSGCSDVLDLPSDRTFKISVDFGKQRAAQRSRVRRDPSTTGPMPAFHALRRTKAEVAPFNAEDEFDVALVRWAQDDIAHDARGVFLDDPFGAGAVCIGKALNRDDITAEMVIARLEQLRNMRVVRRFGAMVRHLRIGFASNSMTVWDIPDNQAHAAGEAFARTPFVSHCYTRGRAETWPINLYAMVHAQSDEELQEHLDELAQILVDEGIECRSHNALQATCEYKKVSMRYFEE